MVSGRPASTVNSCNVYGGGNYNQNLNHGLFYVNRTSVSNANANHGSRISDSVKIPYILAQDVAHLMVKIDKYGSGLVHP